MNSTNNDGNESSPSEDEDRSLLFGPPKEGTEPAGGREKPRRPRASASSPPSRTSPPAAEAVAEPSDPAGRAGPLASSDAIQRRILALLEGLAEKVKGPAAGETDLAAAARTIAEQAERIGAATEWVNNIKAAISEILASTGKQIEGLESAQEDHDAALARLKILEEGLDRVVGALDATAKGLDQRSSELKAVKQELAGYYGEWIAEAKTSRGEMKALSERLDAGDHMVTRLEGLQKGWTEQTARVIAENAAAQRSAAEQTSDAVEELVSEGTAFLKSLRRGKGGRARGDQARVDADPALDGAGAGGGAGSCRAVVRGGGGGWSERVRRLGALRRHSGLEAGGVGPSWQAGAGLHAQFPARTSR